MKAGGDLADAAAGLSTEVEYGRWSLDRTRWTRNTRATILAIYEGTDQAKEFESSTTQTAFIGGTNWTFDLGWDIRFIQAGVNTLASFDDSLEFDEAPAPRYSRCGLSKSFKNLKAGKYEFYARAIGPGGVDKSPATYNFRIS